MRFLDKLRALISPQPRTARLQVAVRCSRCGEVVRTQIDLHHDLSVDYGEAGTRYYCRKELVGSGANRCFQRIAVVYVFGADRNVIDRQVDGGSFVDQQYRESKDGHA
jgi:hypothetical protein